MSVVFGTVLLGMVLSALDQTVVSTALPTIVTEDAPMPGELQAASR